MPRDRRRVYFSGRVQGVGFRFTCQSLARGFEVAGYVRNLPTAGSSWWPRATAIELDAFLAAIQLEMDRYITNVTTESGIAWR